MTPSKLLNVIFFVTEFPAISETFIINQIIGLQQEGYLVHVFSEAKPSSKIVHRTVIDAGLLNHTFYLDKVSNSRVQKIIKLLQKLFLNLFNKNIPPLIKAVLKNNSHLSVYDFIPFLDKPQYDIVHAHFGINGNYVTELRKLGLFKNAKFITTFHGYDLNEVFSRSNFYTSLFEDCNLFTVNSFYSKKRLLQLKCNEKKIRLLPVGVDTTIFRKQSINTSIRDEMRLLFVGRLIKLKGPDLFIEMCKKLVERKKIQFNATIIGTGPMVADIFNIINQYDLKNVTMEGALTQEDVLRLMDQSDIFILPGLTIDGLAEAQGLVIQEAQAMQLPVIVSDAGGMREGMIDGITGFVVPEGDINGFVEKIELLAKDSALRIRMGEAGRKFVAENFDIHILNERLMQIYLN
jgi:colanic acid/amylovoran biosynthesis glycosyltransferase